jgi:Castor and Pollux protein voltage-gated ion channel component
VPLVPRRSPDQSLTNRLGYRIDRFLGLHPAVQLAAVLNVAVVLAFLFGCTIYLLDAPGDVEGGGVRSLTEGFWWAITRLLDGGTVASDGRTGFVRQVFAIGVTLLGLVAVTVLTGAFASSFSDRLSAIRRGSLPVFERGHVLLLGWNAHAGVIVRELGRTGTRMRLVIVADRDRDTIEESVREQLLGWKHRLDVVVRHGDPATVAAVRKAAARRARAVVILPDSDVGHCHDRAALRSLLALERVLGDRVDRPHIIVEVASQSGREMVRLCEGAGRDVVVVEAHGVNARVLAQSVRQRGAFGVARAILSLDSLSIYHYPPALFTGLTFDDAHASIRSGILVGLLREGAAVLSPPGGEVIGPSDQLLVFSDQDVRPRIAGVPDRRSRPSLVPIHAPPPALLRLLILRVRPGLVEILELLDARGPVQATLLAPADEIAHAHEAVRLATLHRTTINFVVGDPLDGPTIDRVLAEPHDTALLLAPDVAASFAAEADADQLISLLQLRRRRAEKMGAPSHAVVEVRSPEARLPRNGGHVDDFILSREVVGMLLAREIYGIGVRGSSIYHEVLDAVNPSVELRPLSLYAPGEAEITFAELALAARRRGEVAIGIADEKGQPRLLPDFGDRFHTKKAHLVVLSCAPDLGPLPAPAETAG